MKEPVNTKPSVNTTQEEKTSMVSAVSSRGREIKKPACHTWSLNHVRHEQRAQENPVIVSIFLFCNYLFNFHFFFNSLFPCHCIKTTPLKSTFHISVKTNLFYTNNSGLITTITTTGKPYLCANAFSEILLFFFRFRTCILVNSKFMTQVTFSPTTIK